jgi:hypothetical protein
MKIAKRRWEKKGDIPGGGGRIWCINMELFILISKKGLWDLIMENRSDKIYPVLLNRYELE